MLRTLKRVFAFLGVLFALVLVIASFQPNTFHVAQSETIQATPDRIFPYINDLREWSKWSPFETDPNMKKQFHGSQTGAGSVMEWEGNEMVGAGRSEILQSVPPSQVVMKLEMHRPIKSLSHVEFTLIPQGNATQVTWAMSGAASFPQKVMGLLFGDKMVKASFAQGLGALKKLAEARPN